MTASKRKQLEKATSILDYCLNGLRRDWIEEPRINVSFTEEQHIIVEIHGAKYDINVECENERCMVKSVIDAVVLKL